MLGKVRNESAQTGALGFFTDLRTCLGTPGRRVLVEKGQRDGTPGRRSRLFPTKPLYALKVEKEECDTFPAGYFCPSPLFPQVTPL